MKTLPLVFLFAVAVSAQSQSVPCGPAATAAVEAPAAGRTPPVAAKTETGQTSQIKPGAAAGNVAAQIQLNRAVPGRPSAFCRCGTVDASSVTAQANAQQIPILNGLSGDFRFDHVLLRETAKFSSNSIVGVTVGVGRANLSADVVPPFPLMNAFAPNSFWYERPGPPQLTGAYDLALFFKAATALGDGAVSNFESGTVAWEICGYSVPRTAVK